MSVRRDTTPDAAAAQAEVMRRLTPERRMEIALQMSEENAEIARQGELARAEPPK